MEDESVTTSTEVDSVEVGCSFAIVKVGQGKDEEHGNDD